MRAHLIKACLALLLLCGMLFYSVNSIRKFRDHKVAVSVQRDSTEKELK